MNALEQRNHRTVTSDLQRQVDDLGLLLGPLAERSVIAAERILAIEAAVSQDFAEIENRLALLNDRIQACADEQDRARRDTVVQLAQLKARPYPLTWRARLSWLCLGT